MLAGVDKAVIHHRTVLPALGSALADALDERRYFHEVGPGARDNEQFEFACHLKTPEAKTLARSSGTVQLHNLVQVTHYVVQSFARLCIELRLLLPALKAYSGLHILDPFDQRQFPLSL